MKILPCLFALFCLLVPAAQAEGVMLNLNASAERELANDEFQATLYIEDKASDPAVLAERLNRQLARAVTIAKGFPAVTSRNSGYNSWPEYDKNGKLQAWSARASLSIQSRNMQQAGELTVQLQRFMLLSSVDFRVSEQLRRETEQQLIPQAIHSLRAQAQIAARALDKAHIAVRELTLGQNTPPPSFRPVILKSAAMDAAAPSNPDWQAGVSLLRLEVSGKVELL